MPIQRVVPDWAPTQPHGPLEPYVTPPDLPDTPGSPGPPRPRTSQIPYLPPICRFLLFQFYSKEFFKVELQSNLQDLLDLSYLPDLPNLLDLPYLRTSRTSPDPTAPGPPPPDLPKSLNLPGPPGFLTYSPTSRTSQIPYLPPICRSLLFQFQSKGFFQIELQLRKLHKICHPIATTNRFQTFPKDYWHCHLTQWTKTENPIRKISHFLVTN